jgi:hypothetical protein
MVLKESVPERIKRRYICRPANTAGQRDYYCDEDDFLLFLIGSLNFLLGLTDIVYNCAVLW